MPKKLVDMGVKLPPKLRNVTDAELKTFKKALDKISVKLTADDLKKVKVAIAKAKIDPTVKAQLCST